MANVTISDLTSATSIPSSSLFEIETTGNSRKATLAELLAALGIASSSVAGLGSAATPNIQKFASDGRKSGEGVGLGTGVLVVSDGTSWVASDTGLVVAA